MDFAVSDGNSFASAFIIVPFSPALPIQVFFGNDCAARRVND